jgi:hypothetical protein
MTTTASSGGGPRIVTGLFTDADDVERAYEALLRSGYDKGDVNVVMSDDTRRRFVGEGGGARADLGSKSAEGGALGGPTGGRIGILIPIVAAVGASLALPGLVVVGPIAVALAGAAGAGVAAGLIGALGDWGIPEERARQYEGGIHDGGILVGVNARSADDARSIAQQWTALGARHVHA